MPNENLSAANDLYLSAEEGAAEAESAAAARKAVKKFKAKKAVKVTAFLAGGNLAFGHIFQFFQPFHFFQHLIINFCKALRGLCCRACIRDKPGAVGQFF